MCPCLDLLVYAYNSDAPDHAAARSWWETVLSDTRPVALPWAVSLGFLRPMTSRAVLVDPLTAPEAIDHIRSWLARPQVRVLQPGPGHLDLLDELAQQAGKAGALTTEIHLAALAIEHGVELHSNDSDFDRFPGLRWTNPLA